MKTEKIFFATCKTTGKLVRLSRAYCVAGDKSLASTWRGTCPECGKVHRPDRIVARPLEPTNHVCDERCIHATGQKCSCSCGGENHGIGGLGIVAAGRATN